MTEAEKSFEAWWQSDVHGWGPAEKLAEYKLAKDAWFAACAWQREQDAKMAQNFTVPDGCDEPYCLGWEAASRGIATAIRATEGGGTDG